MGPKGLLGSVMGPKGPLGSVKKHLFHPLNPISTYLYIRWESDFNGLNRCEMINAVGT